MAKINELGEKATEKSAQDRQLVIVAEADSPRLRHALDFLLGDLLSVPYVLREQIPAQPDPREQYLLYQRQATADYPKIHCTGLTFETGLRTGLPDFDAKTGDFWCGHDLPGELFACLSLYRLYLQPPDPVHGRHTLPDPALHADLYDKIEVFRTQLADLLECEIPFRHRFSYEVTIDVDHPWKYRHKPFHVRWGGLLKDLLQLRFGDFRERLSTLLGGPDPYDTFDDILNICPRAHTRFFFLVDGNEIYDSRYDLRMPPYRQLAQRIQKAGFGLGLHPSYATWRDLMRIQSEKQLLEDVVGPVTYTRQHYLRYNVPETFRLLIEAGFDYEYSLAPIETTGPVNGLLHAFSWYDLEREETTTLKLVPGTAMDRGLQRYQGLGPEAGWERIRAEIARARRVQGHFVIILHNETFSDRGEWKGWRKVLEQMLNDLEAS